MKGIYLSALTFISLGLLVCLHYVQGCNEAVCASIVSKCMILQSCKCDFKSNCSCCKECSTCLNSLYSECCSCVGMCAKPNYTTNALSKKSHVEEFPDSVPSLFETLSSEPDALRRWISFTYPIDIDISYYRPKYEREYKILTKNVEQEVDPIKDIITINCTVVYMSQCMSWNKCKSSCISMGAASYRWFHDGCCECVSDKCINYGINESRCLQCPAPNDDNALDENTMDYGEDDEDLQS